MLKISETQIQKQIMDYLISQRILYWRLNTQGIQHFSQGRQFFKPNPNRGMADILAILNGRAFWIEVKSAKGKLSPEQILFAEKVVQQGCLYIVAKSIDDVIKVTKRDA